MVAGTQIEETPKRLSSLQSFLQRCAYLRVQCAACAADHLAGNGILQVAFPCDYVRKLGLTRGRLAA